MTLYFTPFVLFVSLLMSLQARAMVFQDGAEAHPKVCGPKGCLLLEEPAVHLAAASEPAEAKRFRPPSDAEVSINGTTQDTYHWSAKNERYELKEATFRVFFRLSSDSRGLDFPISVVSRTDRPEKNAVRSLVVYHPNSVAFSSFLNGQKVREYTTQAQMDKNEEHLTISFPSSRVKDLFIKSLQLVAYGEVVPTMQSEMSSSDYHCRIQGQNLVCSIEYSTKARLSEALSVLPDKKRDSWSNIIKLNTRQKTST